MRKSTHYVATLDPLSAADMLRLDEMRKFVQIMNIKSYKQHRVVVRGRKPIHKIHYSYDQGGNIVGGLRNASKYDVYIYERR